MTISRDQRAIWKKRNNACGIASVYRYPNTKSTWESTKYKPWKYSSKPCTMKRGMERRNIYLSLCEIIVDFTAKLNNLSFLLQHHMMNRCHLCPDSYQEKNCCTEQSMYWTYSKYKIVRSVENNSDKNNNSCKATKNTRYMEYFW